MKNLNKEDYKICIVGLGYVGLPLAARFSLKGFNVIGFDIKEERINQLANKIDINGDISYASLETLVQNSKLTSNVNEIIGSNIFIITVPTPINEDKTPDLRPLEASSELVGKIMQKDSIVIYESTVYPGVTDEFCTSILEEKSNLIFNEEFFTGYSPPGNDLLYQSRPVCQELASELPNCLDAMMASFIRVSIPSKPTETGAS